MEGNDVVTNKRYNNLRQSKRIKRAAMDKNEERGRRYKMENFLKDCSKFLSERNKRQEEAIAGCRSETEQAESKKKKPKKKQKPVTLPVLNECKGLFENAIIGRSAKKGCILNVMTFPEDRARLNEDIHALAKVGPDSERSFEVIPTNQEQVIPPVTETEDQSLSQELPTVPVRASFEEASNENMLIPQEEDEERSSCVRVTTAHHSQEIKGNKFFQEQSCQTDFHGTEFKEVAASEGINDNYDSDRYELPNLFHDPLDLNYDRNANDQNDLFDFQTSSRPPFHEEVEAANNSRFGGGVNPFGSDDFKLLGLSHLLHNTNFPPVDSSTFNIPRAGFLKSHPNSNSVQRNFRRVGEDGRSNLGSEEVNLMGFTSSRRVKRAGIDEERHSLRSNDYGSTEAIFSNKYARFRPLSPRKF